MSFLDTFGTYKHIISIRTIYIFDWKAEFRNECIIIKLHTLESPEVKIFMFQNISKK